MLYCAVYYSIVDATSLSDSFISFTDLYINRHSHVGSGHEGVYGVPEASHPKSGHIFQQLQGRINDDVVIRDHPLNT